MTGNDPVYWHGKPVEPQPVGRDAVRNWHEAHAEALGLGDRVADRVAAFIGSWAFIIGQTGVMAIWILWNS